MLAAHGKGQVAALLHQKSDALDSIHMNELHAQPDFRSLRIGYTSTMRQRQIRRSVRWNNVERTSGRYPGREYWWTFAWVMKTSMLAWIRKEPAPKHLSSRFRVWWWQQPCPSMAPRIQEYGEAEVCLESGQRYFSGHAYPLTSAYW